MGHVAHMRERKGAYKFWWGDQSGGDRLEDLGVDGTKILKLIFKEWTGEAWTGLLWIGLELVIAVMNIRGP